MSKNVKKVIVWAFFGQNFQKNWLIQKFEKPVPEVVSEHDFQANLAFFTQNHSFSLSQKFLTKKTDFLPFSHKISIFSKI